MRADVCRSAGIDIQAADDLSLDEAADILERVPTATTSNASDPIEQTADVKSAGPKSKRSTERGEGRAKLISALTEHHKYAGDSCLNLEPIGNNELARLAEVRGSTASEFFNREFNNRQKKGYAKYRVICRDAGRLADSLKALNGEFSPHDLYGRRPYGEDERKDDE